MLPVKMVGKHFFRRPFLAYLLIIQSVLAAKIRDCRFRRNTCSAKENNMLVVLYHLSQLFNTAILFSHFPSLLSYMINLKVLSGQPFPWIILLKALTHGVLCSIVYYNSKL